MSAKFPRGRSRVISSLQSIMFLRDIARRTFFVLFVCFFLFFFLLFFFFFFFLRLQIDYFVHHTQLKAIQPFSVKIDSSVLQNLLFPVIILMLCYRINACSNSTMELLCNVF